MGKLAVTGGKKVFAEDLTSDHESIRWPIITREHEEAVLAVLRSGNMSGIDITRKFEDEFKEWMGVEYAQASCNGTASLQEALWACGVGAGDEVICPSITYWASCTAALPLGAAVNFADIDPETLCIDPDDIEHRIGPRTRAIVVVHYCGHPCDMDRIMAIARKHSVKVIEDLSHAHGALYKGRLCGTIGDVCGCSMMSGKSFPIGEGGMLFTNDREIYERAMLFGHYERLIDSNYAKKSETLTDSTLAKFIGAPAAGVKHRLNQLSAALGRVQIKCYPAQMEEIQKAMNYFWDCIGNTPGLHAHRITLPDSTMGGWYYARGIYHAEELEGLPGAKFMDAVWKEGCHLAGMGANKPLHRFKLFNEMDFFHQGKPTSIAFGQRDVRQNDDTLPVSSRINEIAFGIPWFKKFDKNVIEQAAEAYRKVSLNYKELL